MYPLPFDHGGYGIRLLKRRYEYERRQLTDFPEQKARRKYRTRLEHNEIPNSVRFIDDHIISLIHFFFFDSSLFLFLF